MSVQKVAESLQSLSKSRSKHVPKDEAPGIRAANASNEVREFGKAESTMRTDPGNATARCETREQSKRRICLAACDSRCIKLLIYMHAYSDDRALASTKREVLLSVREADSHPMNAMLNRRSSSCLLILNAVPSHEPDVGWTIIMPITPHECDAALPVMLLAVAETRPPVCSSASSRDRDLSCVELRVDSG